MTDVIEPVQPVVPKVQPKEEMVDVTVNGKKEKVTMDDLKRSYSLDTASRQRFTEAEKKFKEAEQLKNAFSSKDISTLRSAGWTDDEIEEKAAQFIINQAKIKSMTPEQKAQLDKEEEYSKLKKEKDDREESEKQKVQKDLQEREAALYQKSFLSDIKKINNGNKTWLDLNDPIILSQITNDVITAIKKHNYDMPVLEAVRRLEEKYKGGSVKKEYLKQLLKNNIKDIDDSDLDAFLEKGAKGIREKSVEAIKRAEAPFSQTTAKPETFIPPKTNSYREEAQRYRDLRYGRIKK